MKSNALVAPYGYRPHGVSAAFKGRLTESCTDRPAGMRTTKPFSALQAIKKVPQQARPFPSALQRVTDS